MLVGVHVGVLGLSGRMQVLMVAEKPSIALAVAQALAQSPVTKRKGISPSAPVWEYSGTFVIPGGGATRACFKVTSTVGHMWGLDFAKQFNDQNRVDPAELFGASTVHLEDPRPVRTAYARHALVA